MPRIEHEELELVATGWRKAIKEIDLERAPLELHIIIKNELCMAGGAVTRTDATGKIHRKYRVLTVNGQHAHHYLRRAVANMKPAFKIERTRAAVGAGATDWTKKGRERSLANFKCAVVANLVVERDLCLAFNLDVAVCEVVDRTCDMVAATPDSQQPTVRESFGEHIALAGVYGVLEQDAARGAVEDSSLT